MFDIGWSEMAIIAFVALIVIGPKDLPKTMKTVAQWMRKARSLTREFQSGIDDMVREAELEDARKALDATRGGNLKRTLSNAIDPDDEVGKEVRSVEHEASRRDDSAKPAGSNAGSNADKAAAKMISQPASPAPPHSLTPPAEAPAAGGKAEPEPAGPASQGSKQSA
ncbi:Sec-independent protein translocase protein TatB [Pelagibius sp. 7325]|uniref:Sec-independent protein translocase protein TatB n=1 Tax=Pelagibius sp. 7325 TaxID=3131994 RepID=UPI0030ED0A06